MPVYGAAPLLGGFFAGLFVKMNMKVQHLADKDNILVKAEETDHLTAAKAHSSL